MTAKLYRFGGSYCVGYVVADSIQEAKRKFREARRRGEGDSLGLGEYESEPELVESGVDFWGE